MNPDQIKALLDGATLSPTATLIAQAALTAMAENEALQSRHGDDRHELNRMTAESEVLQARVAELEAQIGDEHGCRLGEDCAICDARAILKGTPDAKT